MKNLNQLAIAFALSMPLAAFAQSPSSMDKAPSPNVKPADTPSSEMQRKQSHRLTASAEVPAGHGTTGSASASSTTASSDTASDGASQTKKQKKWKSRKTSKSASSDRASPPGDLPDLSREDAGRPPHERFDAIEVMRLESCPASEAHQESKPKKVILTK